MTVHMHSIQCTIKKDPFGCMEFHESWFPSFAQMLVVDFLAQDLAIHQLPMLKVVTSHETSKFHSL